MDDLQNNSFPTGYECHFSNYFTYTPALFTIFATPILLIQAKRVGKRFESLPFSILLLFKVVLCSLLFAISTAVLCHYLIQNASVEDYFYSLLLILSHSFMTLAHFYRKKKGMITSGIQHISALLFLIFGCPEFYQRIRQGYEFGFISTLNILYYYYYVFLFIYCVLLCFADSRKATDKAVSSEIVDQNVKQNHSPELDSSFLNRIVHWWYNSLPLAGSKKDLELDDLFELNDGATTSYLIKLWEKHLTEKNQWITFRTLFSMFKWQLLTASFVKLCSDILQFANPFLLYQMILFVSKADSPLWEGLFYAILMFTFSEIRSIVLNYYIYVMMRLGVKFQTALTAAIYRKTMTLSNRARRKKTVGEIVNLMAIDVDVFYVTSAVCQQFWSIPIQITMALIYLYFTIGYSAIVGVIIMAIFVPTNLATSVIIKNWQVEQMRLKDERTKMINEVLNGMKVIKLYAWEIPMKEHIENIRKNELDLTRKSGLVKNIIDAFNAMCPFLVALFTFSTYVLASSENRLTPQVAFVALTLFNQLRVNMNTVAMLTNQAVLTYVANRRIQNFFKSEELETTVVTKNENSAFSAEMKEFSAAWDNQERITLSDITMAVGRGDLLAIVGKVGSGKSSLLQALLGEMGKLRGRIGVHGKLAYVPQQAWIQNMTVRDNILFGRPYNKQLYNKVLYACALVSDLKILPNGDQTEIGEKGINLSGGQKARISLARAVYQNYDVYLLDDPLSAVDAHVGKHIFEKVIGPNGLLKDKTRIFVTHGINYAKQSDEIFVLDEGKIIENGTYNELVGFKGKFFEFLEEFNAKSQKEVSENEENIEKKQDNTKKNTVFRSNQFKGNETVDNGPFIWAYSAFGLSEGVTLIISYIVIVFTGLKASKNLHTPLVYSVLRSPMEFFDTTPLGRILNRCTKDIESVDFSLPMNFRLVMTSLLQLIFTLIAIVIATPPFIIVIIPLAAFYYYVLKYFVTTSRQLSRLQSTNRSPIFSHFGETLQGATSIRAFDKVEEFNLTAGKIMDRFIRCKYLDVVSTRWLAIFFAALFVVLAKEFGWTESPGIVGVSISYALSITDVLNNAVRQLSVVEGNIVAVERIVEYMKTPSEAKWEMPSNKPDDGWPIEGRVDMEKYSTRYRAGLDLVLRQISTNVAPGEKIGIVGRTGAGKSSFTLALFRLIEPAEGKITIDGVDISKIGLHDLRSALTIIPQDPVLFSGTLRFNLDPFDRCSDAEIWQALELAHLKEMASSFEKGLQHHISEGGENISVGQRQLVCLARALLRRTRILVLDEATAAVDVATDALIQTTIREQFKECTVFTIAHRLNTILDYDRIMVLDKGEIAEFDSPQALLQNSQSILSKMVADFHNESSN